MEPGETTLVCCNGLWGERFSDMAERNGELPIGETCNLLEPGETTLVCCNGLWGERFSDMAERNGELPIGETYM